MTSRRPRSWTSSLTPSTTTTTRGAPALATRGVISHAHPTGCAAPSFDSTTSSATASSSSDDRYAASRGWGADSSPSSEEQDRGSDSSDEKRGKESLLRPGRARKRWVMHSHGKAHHQRRRDEKGTGSSEEESDSGSGSDGDDDGNHRGDTLVRPRFRQPVVASVELTHLLRRLAPQHKD